MLYYRSHIGKEIYKIFEYFIKDYCYYKNNFCDGKPVNISKFKPTWACNYYINNYCTHPENPKNQK